MPTPRRLVVLVAATTLWLTGCPTQSSGPPTVVGIVDGDTVIVRIAGQVERVRLLGIDTPESVDPSRPVQCFGVEASDHLSSLLPPGSEVVLTRDVEARDRYGRLLAHVHRSADGLFINEHMLRSGHADLLVIPPNTAHQASFTDALAEAQTSSRGLWGACASADSPIDPPPVSSG
jgi:micrococcal nuclease